MTWRGEPLGRTGVATWVELLAGQEMPRERPAYLSLLARLGQPRYHDAKKSAHFDLTPPVGIQHFETLVLHSQPETLQNEEQQLWLAS